MLGLVKLENKAHLLFNITICYLFFLCFYLFEIYYDIIRDYISIAMIPFVFVFLYYNIETKRKESKSLIEYILLLK